MAYTNLRVDNFTLSDSLVFTSKNLPSQQSDYAFCQVKCNTVKFRKWVPGLIFVKGPFWGAFFWRGLYSEGLLYGGKFAFQKLTELACSGKEIYHFCFVLLCIRGQIPSTSPPGGLYLEGRFNGGFFALPVWGAYIWRGLYMEGIIFGILL